MPRASAGSRGARRLAWSRGGGSPARECGLGRLNRETKIIDAHNSSKELELGQLTQWETSRLRLRGELGSQPGGCVRQRERSSTV